MSVVWAFGVGILHEEMGMKSIQRLCGGQRTTFQDRTSVALPARNELRSYHCQST